MNTIIRMCSCCRLRMRFLNCKTGQITSEASGLDTRMGWHCRCILYAGIWLTCCGGTCCNRPGDYLPHDADEIEGFKMRLNERLAPTNPKEGDTEWEIGDCLAQWWRPNHETFLYPFLPAHVSRPKELKKLYLIHLPPNKVLSVPKNMKLLAVPLFELYDNTARYGPQLSAIPHYLSRYRFEFVDEEGNVSSVTPGGGPTLPGPHGLLNLTGVQTMQGDAAAVATPQAEKEQQQQQRQEGSDDVRLENGH
ncbi:hypothetical protein HRR80_007111 [Exophiala dermatitidis]|uniref:Cleavage and polyadenylation specificity factor subunit 5 n=1 Tax=Exophiala dermatitidis TaxID=5970 RepID=A0AAN6EP62_EXODE|nr:hypothetical protein HRR76_001322 [Exophiala dermatitidis]KAJ4552542.1 hypothetical protein HRR77_002548 [Exophiala dermatitidis]KAJ4568493.1 hypothetical protein HRR79_004713 [Exophiala dermatitidis]KAJ4579300.1 hypothetical protein HRR82_005088 [Exophiala dermatitidis]KAJ4693345.1 hypothetical protein HRR87_005742 [Exophiala dermatitidis]